MLFVDTCNLSGKAFPLGGLMYKLWQKGVHGKMFQVLHNFVSGFPPRCVNLKAVSLTASLATLACTRVTSFQPPCICLSPITCCVRYVQSTLASLCWARLTSMLARLWRLCKQLSLSLCAGPCLTLGLLPTKTFSECCCYVLFLQLLMALQADQPEFSCHACAARSPA